MVSSVTAGPSALGVFYLRPVLSDRVKHGKVGVRRLPEGILEVRVPFEVEGDEVGNVVGEYLGGLLGLGGCGGDLSLLGRLLYVPRGAVPCSFPLLPPLWLLILLFVVSDSVPLLLDVLRSSECA